MRNTAANYTTRYTIFITLIAIGIAFFAINQPAVAQTTGKIYYVSPTGNDANAGTSSAPFKSINFAAGKMVAGDTLILKDGTYIEAVDNKFPSGESWTKPVTIKAENPRKAILRPSDKAAYSVFRISVHKDQSGLTDAQNEAKRKQFIIIEGLVIDAINLEGNGIHIAGSPEATGIRNPRHIKIINNEVMHSARNIAFTTYKAYGMGILNARGDDVEIINNDIHDNGLTDFDHGIYNYGRRTLIEGNRTYNNRGTGIKGCWGSGPSDGVIIRNNISYDNNAAQDVKYEYGEKGQGRGISCHYARDVKIYNNIVWGAHTSGIDISYEVFNAQVYNNTIYTTGGKLHNVGISAGGGATGTSPSVYDTIIKNNIVYTGNSQPPTIYNVAIIASNLNVRTTISSNLTFGINTKIEATAGNPIMTGNIVGDPKFVSLANKDFRIQAGSAAIDKGESLTSVLTTDFTGAVRPAGAKYDLGAYEYGATGTSSSTSQSSTNTTVIPLCLTDINNDNITDLADYSILISDFNRPYNSRSDFNRDGVVDISDYSQMVAQFFRTCN